MGSSGSLSGRWGGAGSGRGWGWGLLGHGAGCLHALSAGLAVGGHWHRGRAGAACRRRHPSPHRRGTSTRGLHAHGSSSGTRGGGGGASSERVVALWAGGGSEGEYVQVPAGGGWCCCRCLWPLHRGALGGAVARGLGASAALARLHHGSLARTPKGGGGGWQQGRHPGLRPPITTTKRLGCTRKGCTVGHLCVPHTFTTHITAAPRAGATALAAGPATVLTAPLSLLAKGRGGCWGWDRGRGRGESNGRGAGSNRGGHRQMSDKPSPTAHHWPPAR